MCIYREKDVVNKKRLKQSSFKKDHINSRQEDKTGTLYGIGVGPGNPKLITLEALETIRSCNVILFE